MTKLYSSEKEKFQIMVRKKATKVIFGGNRKGGKPKPKVLDVQ